MSIEIYPLGAGQEVGRSCIILNILDKTIMMDCGLHMTYNDQRRFPDFTVHIYTNKKIPSKQNKVDLVLITHFHLDHCGALPYFSEVHGIHQFKLGFNGPIVMSMPTKALLPYMLEDYRKIWTNPAISKDRNNSQQQQQQQQQEEQQLNTNSGFCIIPQSHSDPLMIFTQDQIKACVQKSIVIGLNETQNYDGIQVTAYYAGHLLGACMFHIQYKDHSIVYTGDFNSLADRHLGGAYIDSLQPDLLISESTYATTIRDSKRTRERNFLLHIQEILDKGGKVLIPVFALGRAQELSVLLESYWLRTKCTHGLYFAAGLIEKANQYYKIFSNWESEKIQDSFLDENIFNFKHIQPFDRNLIKSSLPMVLLATPGMLHGGLSMQVFKEWCGNEKNSLVIPGYCVAGTLGNKLLSGVKNVKIDNKDYEVKMQVMNMSFSAHADSRGIIQLINHLQPKNTLFVHGEAFKMKTLGKEIQEKMAIPVYCPANFDLVKLEKIINIERPLKYVGDFKQEMQGFLIEYQGNRILLEKEDQIMSEVNKLLNILPQDSNYLKQFQIKSYLFSDGIHGQETEFGIKCKEISNFIQQNSNR